MWNMVELLIMGKYRVGDEVSAIPMHSVHYSDNGTYHVKGVITGWGRAEGNDYVPAGVPSYEVLLTEPSEVEGTGQHVEVYESRKGNLYGLW